MTPTLQRQTAHEETVLIGEWVEGRADSRSHGRGIETIDEIDGRTIDRGRAKRTAQELDVEQLVVGDLKGVGLDGGVGEGDLAAARDCAGFGPDIRARQAGAGGRAKVVFRLEILKVEGEVQDVFIA